MTGTFLIGTRPRPYLLPRLRVTGDLVRFEACPLRYRLHAVGGWPEAAAADASRLAGTMVHAALDHAGTACRSIAAGGEGLPVDDEAAGRAVAAARRVIDAVSPRGARPPDLEAALDEAAEIARRTILELGPHLSPLLSATEQRLSATRRHAVESGDESHRMVGRFEVAGVLDAVATGIDPDGTGQISAMVAAAGAHPDTPIDVVIDYKLARRPRPGDDGADEIHATTDAHAFQVAAYACLRDRFGPFRPQVGLVIYLRDLILDEEAMAGVQAEVGGSDDHEDLEPSVAGSVRAWRPGRPAPALPFSWRLRRATAIVTLDEVALTEATARIDRLATAIKGCTDREAASDPPRRAWPARPSSLCAGCDVRPTCPAWQDRPAVASDPRRGQPTREPTWGEPEDA